MAFIRSFSSLTKRDTAIAGGKGASLGEMTKAGIPVPPGFVVLADAFNHFVATAKIGPAIERALAQVKPDRTVTVERASRTIRALILKAAMPADIATEIAKARTALKANLLAVRSSATAEDSSSASWAGELESYLNVPPKDVATKVKLCWSSLYTPRAIFYRFEQKLDQTEVAVAVVVQAMIQSEVSGIAFTVHPVTKNRQHIVIEAGWGLGEAIVGGKITPDTYVVSRTTWQIVERNISQQTMMIVRGPKGTVERSVPAARTEIQKYANADVIALAKLCKKIEKHYGQPQDIEWAMADEKTYIVQSRPITTL